MRAIRVASATLLAATALTLTASAASAAVADDSDSNDHNITSFGFRVTPSTIAAGGQVTLNVDGCEGDATATSGVFDDAHIPKGQQSVSAMVFPDAKPGAMYEVTFKCKKKDQTEETGTTDLTIATGRPTSHPTGPSHHGVKAGVGGSLGGLDLHEIALGGALIVGTLGTAYYWTRRRTGDGNS
ncbi:hypothetical protein ACWFRJ_40685 [Streptomyces sp. NPDC055239]